MFILKLHDRLKQELNIGDLVRISDGKTWNFYAQVTYLEKEKTIAPFHTFSFHSIEKADKLPEDAVKLKSEERYNAWFLPGFKEKDRRASEFKKYALDWRECERMLESVFSIELIKK